MLYQESVANATHLLSGIRVAGGREPKINGLNGWVFEQTVHYCLDAELKSLGINLTFREQVTLRGRAKVDLVVGNVAIEIKSGGLFGDEKEKYSRYRLLAEDAGLKYFYLALQESHQPYKAAMQSAFGRANTFFLDETGAWSAFVQTVISVNAVS